MIEVVFYLNIFIFSLLFQEFEHHFDVMAEKLMNATILTVANRKEENSEQEKEQIKLKKEKSPIHEGREDMELEEEKKDKERTGTDIAKEDPKLKHKEKDDEENVEEEGETTMYRLAELEFYYWGGAHKDVFTHKEEMQQHSGKWYPPSL